MRRWVLVVVARLAVPGAASAGYDRHRQVFGSSFNATAIALGFLFGGIGFVAFRYGRTMQQVPPMVLGTALMTYPLFVTSVGWLVAIGVCLTGGLWIWRE